jgi:Spx/MgsR family transcriptional regulator
MAPSANTSGATHRDQALNFMGHLLENFGFVARQHGANTKEVNACSVRCALGSARATLHGGAGSLTRASRQETNVVLRLHGITNCDTVKRARAWLVARAVPFDFVDFKKQAVCADQLTAWAQAVGWGRLLNRQGTTWRKLDEATRQAAEQPAQALALLQAQPSLIKRPVVVWPDGQVSVGFDEADWERRLAQA